MTLDFFHGRERGCAFGPRQPHCAAAQLSWCCKTRKRFGLTFDREGDHDEPIAISGLGVEDAPTRASTALTLAIVFVLGVVAAQSAQAQTCAVLYTFRGGKDGGNSVKLKPK